MKRNKNKTAAWRAYSDLAWTDSIICNPEEYILQSDQRKYQNYIQYNAPFRLRRRYL
jgi:hypothetical protein